MDAPEEHHLAGTEYPHGMPE